MNIRREYEVGRVSVRDSVNSDYVINSIESKARSTIRAVTCTSKDCLNVDYHLP